LPKGNSCGADSKVVSGEIPSSRAVIRVKGLIEEPGWRWPWVARLKGAVSKSGPPIIALMPALRLSITTSEAVAGE
jgi:hypothetical protein